MNISEPAVPVPLCRTFLNQSELDAEYDVEGSVPDFPAYRSRFETASRKSIDELKPTMRQPYGPSRDEYLDLYLARDPDAPILVFFHGGYWRLLASEDFAFAAVGPAAHGITVVNVNYSLLPSVTIDEIVRQARAAIVWVLKSLREFNANPRRIFVGGHSAGAHLAAMCLLTPWWNRYGLPDDALRGG